jgi:hypothetical protein
MEADMDGEGDGEDPMCFLVVFFHLPMDGTVSPGIEPGYIVFSSHKKQCVYLVRRTAIV